jgi:hypothetical protein
MHFHTLYAISHAWLWLTMISYALESAIVFYEKQWLCSVNIRKQNNSLCAVTNCSDRPLAPAVGKCKYSDWNQFFAQCHRIAIRPQQVSLNIVMDSLSFVLDTWGMVAVSLCVQPFFFSSPCRNRRPMLSIVYNICILSDPHISFTLLN